MLAMGKFLYILNHLLSRYGASHMIQINGANELIEGNSSEDKGELLATTGSGFTDSPVNNALVIFFKILLL